MQWQRRVNGILKDEFLLDEELPNLETARRAVAQAIETYNTTTTLVAAITDANRSSPAIQISLKNQKK